MNLHLLPKIHNVEKRRKKTSGSIRFRTARQTKAWSKLWRSSPRKRFLGRKTSSWYWLIQRLNFKNYELWALDKYKKAQKNYTSMCIWAVHLLYWFEFIFMLICFHIYQTAQNWQKSIVSDVSITSSLYSANK